MGRIQSNVGLVTGVPITDTVDQLISISARPRDLLVSRTAGLQQQQVAVSELMALVIGVQFSTNSLGNADIYQSTSVGSSNALKLSTVKTGSPSVGSYQFTPVRQASAQQLLSTGFAGRDEPLGAGSLTIRAGGFLDRGIDLSQLNGGAGVQRGKIKITDKAGDAAVVDLRYVRTIDDVIEQINLSDDIAITAVARGDALRLVDSSGGAGSISVQEVGLTTTAAGLGLDLLDANDIGQDVFRLSPDLALNSLNDGAGVRFNDALNDLQVALADGTTLDIDFDDFSSAASQAVGVTSAANGANAVVTFTAVATGGDYDDVTVRFVDDAAVTQGNETVAYDDSDPDNKTLTFNIDAGQTDADGERRFHRASRRHGGGCDRHERPRRHDGRGGRVGSRDAFAGRCDSQDQ
ncbi:MAG: hypothetical protein QGG36_04230 [Pirellulaceae bacterium]|nr:hypothetical protein [Pirellulaceae bacterium]